MWPFFFIFTQHARRNLLLNLPVIRFYFLSAGVALFQLFFDWNLFASARAAFAKNNNRKVFLMNLAYPGVGDRRVRVIAPVEIDLSPIRSFEEKISTIGEYHPSTEDSHITLMSGLRPEGVGVNSFVEALTKYLKEGFSHLTELGESSLIFPALGKFETGHGYSVIYLDPSYSRPLFETQKQFFLFFRDNAIITHHWRYRPPAIVKKGPRWAPHLTVGRSGNLSDKVLAEAEIKPKPVGIIKTILVLTGPQEHHVINLESKCPTQS